ncbi:uncharacterized protein LOC144158743 [Haemaphysalis longicornis]
MKPGKMSSAIRLLSWCFLAAFLLWRLTCAALCFSKYETFLRSLDTRMRIVRVTTALSCSLLLSRAEPLRGIDALPRVPRAMLLALCLYVLLRCSTAVKAANVPRINIMYTFVGYLVCLEPHELGLTEMGAAVVVSVDLCWMVLAQAVQDTAILREVSIVTACNARAAAQRKRLISTLGLLSPKNARDARRASHLITATVKNVVEAYSRVQRGTDVVWCLWFADFLGILVTNTRQAMHMSFKVGADDFSFIQVYGLEVAYSLAMLVHLCSCGDNAARELVGLRRAVSAALEQGFDCRRLRLVRSALSRLDFRPNAASFFSVDREAGLSLCQAVLMYGCVLYELTQAGERSIWKNDFNMADAKTK